MALLPPIPDRPADRPETWTEYLSRRAIVAMHRQFADELAAWVVDTPPFTVGDVVKSFGRFAAAYEFKRKKPEVQDVLPVFAGFDRMAERTVFIDEDVTWREDAVRRLLADPTATDLFFTDDAGVPLGIFTAGIDPEAKWIDEEIERLGAICEAADQSAD
jgi:hypothetical protein